MQKGSEDLDGRVAVAVAVEKYWVVPSEKPVVAVFVV
jgi:hypothetical protein